MAVTNGYGLNYPAKNRIRRMHEQSVPLQTIAAKVRCTPELVGRYIRTLTKPRDVEPVEDTGGSDDFGPLPGTPDWAQLTPVQKGRISKARNAAA